MLNLNRRHNHILSYTPMDTLSDVMLDEIQNQCTRTEMNEATELSCLHHDVCNQHIWPGCTLKIAAEMMEFLQYSRSMVS